MPIEKKQELLINVDKRQQFIKDFLDMIKQSYNNSEITFNNNDIKLFQDNLHENKLTYLLQSKDQSYNDLNNDYEVKSLRPASINNIYTKRDIDKQVKDIESTQDIY